ncbi:MAG: class I SAM-dependent methyltransferase [Lachnospiraceae bacterium]|nr:class I SAM-dependent methyltransferase [Robinsoniella sp.]MDY3765344.1 class I SAM-dependent methyltransferase [Lachnospiraceae bacterium]
MNSYQITAWCSHFVCDHVKPGDLCIDATMGKGNDTELLCRLVGESGHVHAFDIQQEALCLTQKRLEHSSLLSRCSLHLCSHTQMDQYVAPETVSCIVFNFGYLPTGDHTVCTHADTSLLAIKSGLSLLKKGGLMSLCIYSGGDTGFEERDAILSFLKTLDSRKYLVILSQYYNRPNHPPIPALIRKI